MIIIYFNQFPKNLIFKEWRLQLIDKYLELNFKLYLKIKIIEIILGMVIK
jgi:hypothetical protein